MAGDLICVWLQVKLRDVESNIDYNWRSDLGHYTPAIVLGSLR